MVFVWNKYFYIITQVQEFTIFSVPTWFDFTCFLNIIYYSVKIINNYVNLNFNFKNNLKYVQFDRKMG